ncbi:MAG: LysM peptidoglycan-binding domain-containing protein [Treponema sp.]|nr:LysM peptidoglycan-binding domain-containing protein [Treponema sp.]
MKKITLSLITLIAAIGLASCKTTGATQEDVNSSFSKVYKNYSELVNLEGASTYTVVSGDTLTAISKKFYGNTNGYYFPLIMLASNETVLDPDLIEPGMELTIPDFDKNIRNSTQAKNLKPYFKDIANVYKLKTTNGAADIRDRLIEISNELGK